MRMIPLLSTTMYIFLYFTWAGWSGTLLSTYRINGYTVVSVNKTEKAQIGLHGCACWSGLCCFNDIRTLFHMLCIIYNFTYKKGPFCLIQTAKVHSNLCIYQVWPRRLSINCTISIDSKSGQKKRPWADCKKQTDWSGTLLLTFDVRTHFVGWVSFFMEQWEQYFHFGWENKPSYLEPCVQYNIHVHLIGKLVRGQETVPYSK